MPIEFDTQPTLRMIIYYFVHLIIMGNMKQHIIQTIMINVL